MKLSVAIDPDHRLSDGLATVLVKAPRFNLRWTLDLTFRPLYNQCSLPDPLAMDLLMFASVCYTADKQVSREYAVDNWTREFEIELPVSNPDQWSDAAPDINEMLAFLTGDVWRWSFRALDTDLFQPGKHWRPQQPFLANAVHLFSGGLDSLAGAVDGLAQFKRSRLLLIGHHDGAGPGRAQQSLFEGLQAAYPRRVELLQVRVSHKPSKAHEPSLRSRSLLFLLLGVYTAHALGPTVPVRASENGLMAINIPLTLSRVGSCSTRTMHPFFLSQLTGMLQRLGIQNPIVNPYELKTKGECLAECANLDLLRSLVDESVSCAHQGRRQNWLRRSAKNCGYCYPCLLRRAALHAARLDKGRHYGIDVCASELLPSDGQASGNDLRAVLDFVSRDWKVNELSDEIVKIVSIDHLDDSSKMVARGIREIRKWFRQKGTAQLRRAIPTRLSQR